MEKNIDNDEKAGTASESKVRRCGSVTCTIRGSQISFKAVQNAANFGRNLNYIVDTRVYQKSHRRTKSVSLKRLKTDPELQGNNAQLKDVAIEVDRLPEEPKTEEQKNGLRMPTLDSPKPSDRSPSKSKSKWSVIRSVIRAVSLFRTNEAEPINNNVRLFA